MKSIFLIVLFTAAALTFPLNLRSRNQPILAQEPVTQKFFSEKDCPTVSVVCPTDIAQEGTPITFTANVSGGDPNVTPVFNWTVSSGTITSGQGTPSITVDTSGLGGQMITATVEVSGYPNCPTVSESCSISIAANQFARMFDRYGKLTIDQESRRLDNYAIALQNEPGAQSFIIAYAGRCDSPSEAQRSTDRAKRYLADRRNIDRKRILTNDGGLRENLEVELWIAPGGSSSPPLSPTVERSGGPRCRGRRQQ